MTTTSKTPRLTIAAILLFYGAGCSTTNAQFCDQEALCPETQRCDLASNTCMGIEPAMPEVGDAGLADGTAPTCDNTCVRQAPEGWTGPLARSTVANGEALGACVDGLGDQGIYYSEIIEQGSCDCSCGKATNLDCGSGKLQEWTRSESACESKLCDIVNGTCLENSLSLPPNSCVPIPSALTDEPYLRATFGLLSGGSCTQAQPTSNLSSRFATQTRICLSSVSNQGCQANEVCAPLPPADFLEGMCIVQDGEHSCPLDSDYTERSVLFSSLSDNRVCNASSCSCSPPSGSCGGEVQLHNGGVDNEGCVFRVATLKGGSGINSGNLCQALPSAAGAASYLPSLDGRSCSPSGQASIEGSAVGQDAQTLCCMP